MTPASGRSFIRRFGDLKTLVVGDLMLDHFIWGTVTRISPEAPVPVVDVSRETEMPGGAGNVAVNMAALGAEVFLVGVLGEDASGDRLVSLLDRVPVQTTHLIRSADRPTILKMRVIAHHQQVVRVDREIRTEFSVALRVQISERVRALLPQVDAVVLSDYGKGMICPALIKDLIRMTRRKKIPLTVDPKIENFKQYRQVTCVTPNLKEALEGSGIRQATTEDDVETLGRRILKQLKSRSVLITRGEKGMSLFEQRKPPVHIPTRAREVFDVTGAGDTVISTLTLALAAGAPLRAAAELANYAAGIVVGKVGTAHVTGEELEQIVGATHHG